MSGFSTECRGLLTTHERQQVPVQLASEIETFVSTSSWEEARTLLT